MVKKINQTKKVNENCLIWKTKAHFSIFSILFFPATSKLSTKTILSFGGKKWIINQQFYAILMREKFSNLSLVSVYFLVWLFLPQISINRFFANWFWGFFVTENFNKYFWEIGFVLLGAFRNFEEIRKLWIFKNREPKRRAPENFNKFTRKNFQQKSRHKIVILEKLL